MVSWQPQRVSFEIHVIARSFASSPLDLACIRRLRQILGFEQCAVALSVSWTPSHQKYIMVEQVGPSCERHAVAVNMGDTSHVVTCNGHLQKFTSVHAGLSNPKTPPWPRRPVLETHLFFLSPSAYWSKIPFHQDPTTTTIHWTSVIRGLVTQCEMTNSLPAMHGTR